jgi:hypothetical protein
MAEYKLGRIKFVYQGTWTTGTSYVVDDVVTVGGKTYICTVTNTAAATFSADLSSNYWSKFADGNNWRGAWANGTFYNAGDLVQYGGTVYNANTAHTSTLSTATITATGFTVSAGTATLTYASQVVQPFLVGTTITLAGFSPTATSTPSNVNATFTVVTCTTTQLTFALTGTYTVVTLGTVSGVSQLGLETDASKWDTFSTTLNWAQAWTTNARYKAKDLVTYGGYTYVANAGHVSANTTTLGLEADSGKWDTFNAGVIYRSTWSGSTVRYRVNDVVTYGADLWICTTQHTSATIFDDTKWNIFVNGLQFESSWSTSTIYQIGDLVTYGGATYTAIQNHSGQTPSTATAYWQVFTTGFNFRGDWLVTNSYRVSDVVRLGSYTYVATVDNTQQIVAGIATTISSDGTRPNQITLASGITITGASVTSTTATLTYATQPQIPFATGQTIVVAGVTNTAYNGTFVVTGTPSVTQVQYTLTGSPASSSGGTVSGTTANLVAGLPIVMSGTTFGGIVSGTTYYVYATPPDSTHFVLASSPANVGVTPFTITSTATGSMTGTTNPTPPFASYWSRLNSGIRWNSTTASYTAVSGTNIIGSGASATFNVSTSGTAYTVTVNAGGTGYANTNTLKILGTSVGGLSPANDIIVTVSNASGGIIQSSGVTWTGYAVTWVSGTSYVLGDTVYHGANSYICINAHVGTSGNRPDADTTATYWNLLSSGAESASLTTQGDIFYYGANGPTRLPIGTDGQVLRVNGTTPAWQYYGTINNVVYVGSTGTDIAGTGQGLTIDKPWLTVRFAAKQVEDGYLNTNARDLLSKNKQFILKEVSNYVSYTYQVSATGTSSNAFTTTSTAGLNSGMPVTFTSQTGSLTLGGSSISSSTVYYIKTIVTNTSFTVASTYSGADLLAAGTGTAVVKYYTSLPTEVERDAGYTLDGIIFDVSHGGNSKTVTNAKAYFNSAGSGYINTQVQYQLTQFVGAQNYLASVIGSVLANTAPATIYQTQNGISAGNQAKQIIDTTLPAETGTTASAQGLIGIITTALTNGTTATIPVGSNPNTTIFVKTGTYNEVLPIVVAANTAIVGDELRSTVVQPQSAIVTLVNDKPKSINSLTRIKSLLSNLISNTVITASTGNSQVISVTGSTGSAGTATLTFATQSSAPFVVGQSITVSGFTGGASGYNASAVVTACTTTSVSYANATTAASAGTPIVTSQVTGLSAGDTGSTAAVASAITNSALMQQIIQNGVSQALSTFTFSNPTGYNASYLVGYGDGKAQIVNNYAFIKADVANYFANTATAAGTSTVSAVWSALTSAQQANFYVQVNNILDAVQYDMTYGTSTQSQIIGSNYYSYGVSQLTANQRAAYVIVYAFLQSTLNNIITKAAITPQSGNVLTTAYLTTAGSAVSSSFAQARVGDIIYWINNGVADTTSATFAGTISATTLSFSSVTTGTVKIGQIVTGGTVAAGTYITAGSGLSWTVSVSQSATATGSTMTITPITSGAYGLATTALQTAYNAVIARQAEIQNDTVGWVQKYYQTLNFTSSTCYRDAGYIVQALAYDLLLGSNTASIIAARQYYNGTTSAAIVTSGQLAAEIGSIGLIGAKVKSIAASGAVVQASTIIDDTIAYINGQVAFTTVVAASVSGTQGTSYSSSDVITVTSGSQVATFTPTLTTATTGLTISTITSGGTATFSSTITVIRGQSVSVPVASGGMSAGTYYVTSSATNTTQVILSSSYANAVSGTAGSFTGGIVTGASSNVSIGVTYNTIASVTIISGGVWTSQLSTSFATTASVSSGTGLQLTLNYGSSSYTTTLTTATTSTNVLTVASTTGMSVGMPITFTGLPANITTTASAISSNNITLGATVASLGIVSGQAVYFTGLVFGGINAYQTYYIINPSASVIQISATLGGSAVTLTNVGSGSMSVVINAAGGLVASNTYWINTIPSGTTLTIAATYQNVGSTAFAITNTVSSMTASVFAGATPQVNGTITYNNSQTIMQGVEILRANKTFLAYEAAAYTTQSYGGTVSTTTASNDRFTTGSAHNFTVGDPVVFSGTTYTGSGITVGTVYYIVAVPTGTTFTVTATQNSSTVVDITVDGSGSSLTVRYYYVLSKCVRDTIAYIDALVYDLQFTGNYKSTRAAQLYLNAVNGSLTSNMFLLRNATGLRNMTLSGLTGYLSAANIYGTRRPTAGAYSSLDAGFGSYDTNVWINSRSPYTQNVTMFGYACSGMKIDGALHAGGNRSIVANDYTTIIGDGIGVWCTGSNSLTELVSVFNYYGYAGYLAELGGRMRATNGNSSYGTYGVIAEGVDTYETPIYAVLNNRANQAYITNVVTDSTTQVLRIEYANAGSGYSNYNPSISGSGYNAAAVGDELRDASTFETRIIDPNDGSTVGGTSHVTVSNTAQGGAVGYITIAATDTAISGAYAGMRIQTTAGTAVGQFANIISYTNGSKNALIVKDSFTPLIITSTATSNSLLTVASTATLYVGMPLYFPTAPGSLLANTLYYVIAANFSATQFAVSTASGGSAQSPGTTAGVTVTVTATATTNNLITATNTLTANQAITFSSSFNGISTGVTYYVLSTNLTTASFSVSRYIAGPAEIITTTGAASSTGTVGTAVLAAGWDHVVPGTTIQNVPDLTTSYIIEPRIGYTIPGYTATARTLATATTTWSAVTYGNNNYIAIANGPSTTTNYSVDGKNWLAGGALSSSQAWIDVIYGGGQGATATAIVGGLGGVAASLTAVLGTGSTSTQVVGVTIVNGGTGYTTPPNIIFTGGGGTGATATCTVLNGVIINVTVTIPGSGYSSTPTCTANTSILNSITMTTWGRNYTSAPSVFVSYPQGLSPTAFTLNSSVTLNAYLVVTATGKIYQVSQAGTTDASTTPSFDYTSATYTNVTNGTAKLTYIATQAIATAVLTNSGVSSVTFSTYGYGYTSTPTVTFSDSGARYVAVSGASTTSAYLLSTSTLTTAWTAGGALPSSNIQAITYGSGIYAVVGGASATGVIASSTDATSWTSRTGPTLSAGSWSSVTYGAGYFVAINTGGNLTAVSANGTTWNSITGGVLPASTTWTSIAYGNGRFVALAITGAVAYQFTTSLTSAWIATPTSTGTTTSVLSSSLTWSKITYGQGLFMAIAKGTTVCATSPDGINWTVQAMPSSSNWQGLTFGNITSTTLGAQPLFVAVSNTSGTVAASIRTGAQALGRTKASSGSITEIRMIEPGSGYPKGNVSATTVTTNLITVDDATNLVANQIVEFNIASGNLSANTPYYVIGSTLTSSQFSVSVTPGSTIAVVLSTTSPTGMIYRASPTAVVIDPNKVIGATTRQRTGDGALGNPSFTNRGTANSTATASVTGDGYSDLYQVGSYINVVGLSSQPTAGANVQFASITGSAQWFKLVSVTNFLPSSGVYQGLYSATFQINPALTIYNAPGHAVQITTRLKYSQVRLTGHDFLYIGTGNQTKTNYPYVDPTTAVSANQTNSSGGGRVFFTSTDQDGNFNVGNLFNVKQATGTATLNANAFNLSGLQSLTLTSLSVGNATITAFSTDPYFTANSDNIVPTQKAIKSYITAQIGGGQSALNVNTLTAGQIYIANNTISNTTGNQILVSSKMNFTGGIDGAPVALVFFGQR